MKELKNFAKIYWDLGLNIACCKNEITEFNFTANNILKCPYHDINILIYDRQSLNHLNSYDWDNVFSIGAVTGFKSLIALDFDECLHVNLIRSYLERLGLPKDYEWLVKTGSHTGFQILLYLEDEWPFLEFRSSVSFQPRDEYKFDFNKIEILRNSNAVLPPSLHTSGLKYEFSNCNIPSQPPSELPAINILEFIDEFAQGEPMWSSSFSRANSKPIKNKNLTDSEIISFDDYPDKKFYLVFDIETDGLIENGNIPKILQISWSIVDKSGYIYKRKTDLISDVTTNDAYPINKIDITTSHLIGKPLCNVMKELWRDLKNVNAIVAHNIEFDLKVVKHHIENCDLSYDFSSIPKVCTMKGGKNYLESTGKGMKNSKYPKLLELYNYLFSQTFSEKHQAIFDKVLTSRCFIFLLKNDIKYIGKDKYWKKTKWPVFPT